MLPPRYTKTVTVTSQDAGVTITATYAAAGEGQDEVRAEVVLAPGQSHTFPERTENMGTWTAVRKIRHLVADLQGDGDLFEKHVEEDCEGVHTNLHYIVHEKTFKVKAKN